MTDVDGLVSWMLTEGGQRGQGLSPRSAAATLGALGLVLDLAAREGTITRNVARLVKRPRQRRTDPQRWTAAEAAQFRAHALTDRFAAAWLLSLAGLRRSEVLGLRWEDVDLDAGVVRIERGRVAVTPTTDAVDEPKSEQSRRVVPVGLLPGVVDALRAFRTVQARDRLAAGSAYRDSGYVVVDEVVPRDQSGTRTGSAGCAVTLACPSSDCTRPAIRRPTCSSGPVCPRSTSRRGSDTPRTCCTSGTGAPPQAASRRSDRRSRRRTAGTSSGCEQVPAGGLATRVPKCPGPHGSGHLASWQPGAHSCSGTSPCTVTRIG